MADVLKGKLVWTPDKKVRRVIFPKKNGDPSPPTPFDAHQLAPSLKAKTEDEIEVELEVEGGKPVRIRPVGEPWQVAPPPRPANAPRPVRGQRSQPAAPAPTATRASDFVNPYNFLPAIDRAAIGGELGDRPPTTHDRFHADSYTGTIRVSLTTQTPLLIPDAARATENNDRHKTFPVRIGPNGKPYLAPTSVKGMLRSAYEAITNSRLGVFAGWDRRLAFRRQAKVDVEPAIISRVGPDAIELRVLATLWLRSPAKLPRYAQRSRQRDKGESATALRYLDNTLPTHGDHVWVRAERNGRVSEIRKHDSANNPGRDWYEGWVLATGANINNKKSERVFVVSENDEKIPFSGMEAATIRGLWSDLILDYQLIHEKDLEQRRSRNELPSDYLGDEPGRTAWSRHVYTTGADVLAADVLAPGTLVYVRRERGRIVGVFPVAISRQLFANSPLESLPESLRPATEYEKLSPADRVFGWVKQGKTKTKERVAHRGQLRVGPVTVTKEPQGGAIHSFTDNGGSPLPLAILGQPKPAQARFYLGDANGHKQPDHRSKDEVGYDGQKRLRGRKVYPHHAKQSSDHWMPPANGSLPTSDLAVFREYLRPNQVRDDQNRSITGWVKPGTTFTFDLHVTNLSRVELGALLWLLDLRDGYFHRIGLGKPLGFGSVKLAIDKTELHTGNEWKAAYAAFDDVPFPSPDPDSLIQDFENELQSQYPTEAERIRDSFLAAAKGFANLPIYYPRGTPAPNPNGEGYEWFVENERDANRRWTLPELTEDSPGLPRNP